MLRILVAIFFLFPMALKAQVYYPNHFALIDSLTKVSTFTVYNGDTLNRIDSLGRMQGKWRVTYWNKRTWEASFHNDTPVGHFKLMNYAFETMLEGEFKNGNKVGKWIGDVTFVGPDTHTCAPSDYEIDLNSTLNDTTFVRGKTMVLIGWMTTDDDDNRKSRHEYLTKLAALLKSNPTYGIHLKGYVSIDRANHSSYSRIYSYSYLEQIKSSLKQMGIDEDRVTFKTYEDSKFLFLIERNTIEWFLNNRLEIDIR